MNAYLDQGVRKGTAAEPRVALRRSAGKEHADTLDDRTEAGMETRLQWRRKSVADMKAQFDPATWTTKPARRSTCGAAARRKRSSFASVGSRIFVNGGDQAGLPNFLINMHAVSEKANAVAYIARLNLDGRSSGPGSGTRTTAAAEDIRQPRFYAYDKALRESKSVITGEPFSRGADSPLGRRQSQDRGARERRQGQRREAKSCSQARRPRFASLNPAYERLSRGSPKIAQRHPSSRKGVGTQGRRGVHDAQLSIQTTTDKTANDIHALGLSEVARLHTELEQIKTRVGFSDRARVLCVHAHLAEVLPARYRCRTSRI